MKCLCCGKELPAGASAQEIEWAWHKRCVKRFFGTAILPDIDITEESLHLLAIKSTDQGYTVPGVQKKLSLHLTNTAKKDRPRLTLVNYPTGYILKPQTEEYEALPEAEYLTMSMAKAVGINTVPFALIRQDNILAYITKRIDRVPDAKQRDVKMLAMEDFCQLDQRLTQDKYHGSYERCGKVISKYSRQAGLDMTELFIRVVFSYLVGNSDMHLKNFSLIETEENSQEYALSAAYDMLPVNLILPEDKDQLALTLNGKKRNVTKNDFLAFAEACGIEKKTALGLIGHILKKKDLLLTMCKESYMPDKMKQEMEQLIMQRSSTFVQGTGAFVSFLR